MIETIKKLAREPLVHFLLIGIGIYGLYLLPDSEGEPNARAVTVTAGEIQALNDQWVKLWNRPPTEEELSRLVREYVRVQILYREAIAMGLDVGDQVIERRLAQKVELLSRGLSTPKPPTDEELRDWYKANAAQFTPPDRYTVSHIFFDPDKRGDTTLDDARDILAQIGNQDAAAVDIQEYGDRFVLRNHYADHTQLELRKLFGRGFVEQVVALEPDEWHGPILSGFGTHLVLVGDVHTAEPPDLKEVKEQATEAWINQRTDELAEGFIDNLVSRYRVTVEPSEMPLTASTPEQDQ